MPAPYTPLAIANEFIRLSAPTGVDHMKLQKLCYYAQGLSSVDGPLIVNELPEVWKYGPVFPSLYYELKYHGGDAIRKPEKDNLVGPSPFVDPVDRRSIRIVNDVWAALNRLTAIQLSARTHNPGTPWGNIARNRNWVVGRNTPIPEAALRDYFAVHGLSG